MYKVDMEGENGMYMQFWYYNNDKLIIMIMIVNHNFTIPWHSVLISTE